MLPIYNSDAWDEVEDALQGFMLEADQYGSQAREEVAGAVGLVTLSRTPGGVAFMDQGTVEHIYNILLNVSGYTVSDLERHIKEAIWYKTDTTPLTKFFLDTHNPDAADYVALIVRATDYASQIEPVDLPCINAAALIRSTQTASLAEKTGMPATATVARISSEHPSTNAAAPGAAAVMGTPGTVVQGGVGFSPENEEPEEDPKAKLARLYAQLDSLVGLGTVKSEVRRQAELLRVEKLRETAGLTSPDVTRHLVFTGNPGTGKTTIARLVGEIYATLKILEKGQLVEVDKSGLVGGFLGQSEKKTAEAVQNALGGVLFVDEAYALVGDEYGESVIDVLVKAAEDNRDDLVIILAGYTHPMGELLDANPGLRSRFRTVIDFPDYTTDELTQIFTTMVEKSDYECDTETVEVFRGIVADVPRDNNFGNARYVRNCFEEAIMRHAWRLKDIESPTREQLQKITSADLAPSVQTTT